MIIQTFCYGKNLVIQRPHFHGPIMHINGGHINWVLLYLTWTGNYLQLTHKKTFNLQTSLLVTLARFSVSNLTNFLSINALASANVMISFGEFEVQTLSLNFFTAEIICCFVTSPNLMVENITVTTILALCNVNSESNRT